MENISLYFKAQRLYLKKECTTQTIEAVIKSGPWILGPLTVEELEKASSHIQNNKAAGPDNVKNEILKIKGVSGSLIDFYNSA